eukprot:TRINITY_DN6858_c0_g1_i1.p1 TRINITY_DN6858_c0_g1~~TRINITY_DN6858_c0_g1_i1.p1  ORF type:complete len:307 (+),score=76.22 TRINITY_DN6858_c0_g1_i1:51-971(+)
MAAAWGPPAPQTALAGGVSPHRTGQPLAAQPHHPVACQAAYPGQLAAHPHPGQFAGYPGQPATYPGQPATYPGQVAVYPGQHPGFQWQQPPPPQQPTWGGPDAGRGGLERSDPKGLVTRILAQQHARDPDEPLVHVPVEPSADEVSARIGELMQQAADRVGREREETAMHFHHHHHHHHHHAHHHHHHAHHSSYHYAGRTSPVRLLPPREMMPGTHASVFGGPPGRPGPLAQAVPPAGGRRAAASPPRRPAPRMGSPLGRAPSPLSASMPRRPPPGGSSSPRYRPSPSPVSHPPPSTGRRPASRLL